MKFYIATKLENWTAHNEVRDWLTARGHTITYDWTTHGPVWRRGLEAVNAVARAEHDGVRAAELVIVLWPGGRGTHVELGMALEAGCRVVLVSGVEGHHEASPEVCAFYHHPSVERVRTIAELRTLLDS